MISIVVISKDEPSLDGTLALLCTQADALPESSEIVVVDASDGRLDDIRKSYDNRVRWIDFAAPTGIAVSIPHQRNTGVNASRGDIIVFTDAGCQPETDWLARLIEPFNMGEDVTAGIARSAPGDSGVYELWAGHVQRTRYLTECGAGNLAFRKEAFEAVNGFDENFEYGSDIDFTWRLVDAGYRLRSVPKAVVYHDFGSSRRQLRRSYVYGKARARLYRKHRQRWGQIPRTDPMVLAYPLFILGLPITFIFPFYPALLLVPLWRNRSLGGVRVIVDHLTFGIGILSELIRR